MKKFLSILIIFIFIFTLSVWQGLLNPIEPVFGVAYIAPPRIQFSISAKHAVLINGESQTPLLGKLETQRAPMASTTKIMTALLAIEFTENLDEKFTIHEGAVGIEGSSIYLKKGESISMRDLLFALMLESANDAAAAIAFKIGGSIEGFAALMNNRARNMNLVDTNFANPHGLDDKSHYTTAYELAIIASVALENPFFEQIVSTKSYTMTTDEGVIRYFSNNNKMLRIYDGAIGVKTGYTKKDGRTLVSAARRDGVLLIAVTFNAPNDWQDHTKMLDWGFDNLG